MYRAMGVVLAVLAPTVIGLALGGCPQVDLSSLLGGLGATDEQSEPMTLGSGDDAIEVDCGRRAVVEGPRSMFMEMDYTIDMSVSPDDSPLAQAILGENPETVFNSSELFGSTYRTLYDVDADGKVNATYNLYELLGKKYYTVTNAQASSALRFIVDQGCLRLQSATEDPNDIFVPGTDSEPNSPCGEDALVLTRQGGISLSVDVLGQTGGEDDEQDDDAHVCVSTEMKEICIDCWYADGVWHQTTAYDIVYTALGALDGITVRAAYDPNDPNSISASAGTVDVSEGDSFTLSTRFEFTYTTSQSPGELGYEEQSTGSDPNDPNSFDPNDDESFDPNDFEDLDPNLFGL